MPLCFLLFFFAGIIGASGQSTSWIGTTSSWKTASNWTNGVPDASTDAIIGDGNFAGPSQPSLPAAGGSGYCRSLTLGTGAQACVLTLQDDLVVSGDITIGANGTLLHDVSNITLTGSWTNAGTYTSVPGGSVYFTGASQTIGGTATTSFDRLTINSGSTTTLAHDIAVSGLLDVNGTFDPTENFAVTGGGDVGIGNGGVLKVKAATFAGNYAVTGAIEPHVSGSTIDYASSVLPQTVDSALGYGTLQISGTGIKTLGGNTTVKSDLFVLAGATLDLGAFTVNRENSGGSLTIAAGALLMIGGTGSFPANYTTHGIASTSTVSYYGGNQTLAAETYGHLSLSSASGAVVKTMPADAIAVAGNFITSVSGGSLSCTAGNTIDIAGNVTLGASTTFNGGSFAHTAGGNWTNNGIYTGCSSTVTFYGAGAVLSGPGTNTFGNLVIAGNGTTADANTSLSVCGNFSTTGGGTFTQAAGGTGVFAMTGASKTIAGSSIVLGELVVASGASITTASTLTIAGGLTADGTLTATTGTITFSGSSKTIAGNAALQFAALNIPGAITTARDLQISGNMSVAGSFTASAGLTTFNGTSTFSGTARLFDVRIAPAATLTMGGTSTLGIGGTQTLDAGGSLNTTTNIPNTIDFDATGAQSIVFSSFHHVSFSNGATKTPVAALTTTGDFTIGASTTFAGQTFTHNIGGNWVNNGTFAAASSTIQFGGSANTTLAGTTAFNNLAIDKGSANVLTLLSNISTVNIAMTSGDLYTGANAIVITGTRSGSGIMLGTITRTHAYTTGTNYAFEGPHNFINFSAAGSVSSITVTVVSAPVADFPSGSAVNRKYTIAITGAGYTGSLRLHYEQAEVNGNTESAMTLWNDQGIANWLQRGKTSNSVGDNWVELTGQTDLSNGWSLSDGQNVLSWTGQVSSTWTDAANWTVVTGTPGLVPAVNVSVVIGDRAFTNQPVITTTAQVKNVTFGSVTAATLTLAAGSLTVQGNVGGTWSADATHTLNIGSRSLTVFSDMSLSDGVAGHSINLVISTGTVNVSGSFTQAGDATVNFSGGGNLNVSEDFNYVGGTFTAGTGTVTYNGIINQVVAQVPYNNLVIDKVLGLASTATPIVVNGNLQLSAPGGELDLGAALTVAGNVEINSSTILNAGSSGISVGGNWSRTTTGLFVPGSSTVTFTGTATQFVSASAFNNITVNKPAGTLTLLGNLTLHGDISIQSGTLDAGAYAVSRTATGGVATLAAGTTARFGSTTAEFANFALLSADAASTIEYYGSPARGIPPITYGNLVISDGGANAKFLTGPTTVTGNLTVNTGASLQGASSTLEVWGNITANGTFDNATGTLILHGAGKTIAGNIVYNNVVVHGSYTLTGASATLAGNLEIGPTGNLDLGSTTVLSHGDLTNLGTLFSGGTITFSGNQVQTIRLLNAVSSTAAAVVNFNGTVSPVLNATTSPTYATVNINNTAPIAASQSWNVDVAMNVAAGASWDGGTFTHNFYGNFAGSGTVISGGVLNFAPPATAAVNFGAGLASTGKIILGGAGQINLSGTATGFHAIDITNTHAAGITPPAGWTLSANLLVAAGATLHGGTGLVHTIGGGWTNNGTFDGGSSTVIFTSTSGTDEIVGAGQNNFNHLTFETGSSLAVVSPIAVTGNFTNNAASLLFHYGKVTFTGSALSVIGGTAVTDFDELEVNKSSASVRLDNHASVSDILILTGGALDLNAHTLTVINPASGGVTRAAGYVLSESTTNSSRLNWMIGTDLSAHIFPFGTPAGAYIPFTFDLSAGSAGVVSVATFGTAANNLPLPPGVTELTRAGGADNSANVVDRFFQIDLTGSTTPVADITFSASAAEVGSITDLRAQRWNNGWEAPIMGQSVTPTSATVFGVTEFSPWTMSGNDEPLPVTLVSFEGRQVRRHAELTWVTASELNNDRFEIEKSFDGKSFFKIGQVAGAGTTVARNTYEFSDTELRDGWLYYRLRQVDYDGAYSWSRVVAIDIGGTQAPVDIHIHPNPVVDKVAITPSAPGVANWYVTLMDVSGKVLMQGRAAPSADETITLDLAHLDPGPYLLLVHYNDQSRAVRLVRK